MKKSFIAMGLAIASTLFFSNCKKVEVVSNETSLSKGAPFEIVANTEATKTTNDGLDTKWAEGDKITVFHAENGTTTYGSNDKFTVTGAGAASFTGTLQDGELDNTKSYDWYAIYPYKEKYSTPANTTEYQQIANKITQNGYGSTAHLAGDKFPLVGQVKNVKAGTTPNISMKQICAVVKVVVTNNSGEDLKITSAALTSSKVNIAGGYFIDFSGDEPVLVDENVGHPENDIYMFKTVNLSVTGGTAIANGETAALYFGVKPFTAQNETLKIAVNGYEKECVIGAEAVEFKSGYIKTVNFNFDKEPVKLAAGNYAILAKRSSGNYWYMTTDLGTAATKRFTAVDSGLSELPTALTVSADKLWTVSKSGDGYVISTQEGKQISWTSVNSATLADEGKVFTVTSSTGGSFNVSFAATETETRTLALNGSTGSDYFAFYTGSGAKDLFFVPATLNTTPTLTLNKTSITDVPAAGVTDETEENVYTLENAGDGDVTVTKDGIVVTSASISGGTLTYTVAANSGAARDGWVKLALAGQDAKEITVSQEAPSSGPKTVDIIAKAGITSTVTLSTPYSIGNTGITLTGIKGTNNYPALNYNSNNGVDLRFYKGTTCGVTFSIEGTKKITKIEFLKNASTASTLGESFSANTGTLTNNVWTGEASSVTISYNNADNYSGQMYIINVTYKE